MKKIIIVLLTVVLVVSLFANHESLLNELKAKYSATKTFEADLSQTVNYTVHGMTIESTGRLYVDGDDFVIEFFAPMSQFVKVQKGVVTMYLQNENTAIKTAIGSERSNLFNPKYIISLISRMDYMYEREGLLAFKVGIASEPNTDYRVYVSPKDKLLQKVESISKTGDITIINLSLQRFNQSLSKKLSDFVIPVGAQIIEN